MNRKPLHPTRGRPSAAAAPAIERPVWLYGRHAVVAALDNPVRRVRRLVATEEGLAALGAATASFGERSALAVTTVERRELDRLLPLGAVHQGLALEAWPLPQPSLEEVCGAADGRRLVVVLDQVTDPHNVGAILRSAAAFGARAVVLTERRAAATSGALAKAASGALELVPLLRVVNLAHALNTLKELGFWCVGLDAGAAEPLDAGRLGASIALVLGAEGEGLRRLTGERCDLIARLPTPGALADLNVSNAAAIALYMLSRED